MEFPKLLSLVNSKHNITSKFIFNYVISSYYIGTSMQEQRKKDFMLLFRN